MLGESECVNRKRSDKEETQIDSKNVNNHSDVIFHGGKLEAPAGIICRPYCGKVAVQVDLP